MLLQLLGRFYQVLRAQNPELAGEKRRYTIVPPSVHRDGNKKTVFANVSEICKRYAVLFVINLNGGLTVA
jgi:translation initiation factor 2 subunit 2